MNLIQIDLKIIAKLKQLFLPFGRIAIFVIFFWFGILKVLGLSPAEEFVKALHARTLPFIPFDPFYTGFSLFECLIGLLFLMPGATRVVLPLLAIHMFTTALPLLFLPQMTWQGLLVPTLEGQYIIKNLAIIGMAIGIGAHVHPWKKTATRPT